MTVKKVAALVAVAFVAGTMCAVALAYAKYVRSVQMYTIGAICKSAIRKKNRSIDDLPDIHIYTWRNAVADENPLIPRGYGLFSAIRLEWSSLVRDRRGTTSIFALTRRNGNKRRWYAQDVKIKSEYIAGKFDPILFVLWDGKDIPWQDNTDVLVVGRTFYLESANGEQERISLEGAEFVRWSGSVGLFPRVELLSAQEYEGLLNGGY